MAKISRRRQEKEARRQGSQEVQRGIDRGNADKLHSRFRRRSERIDVLV